MLEPSSHGFLLYAALSSVETNPLSQDEVRRTQHPSHCSFTANKTNCREQSLSIVGNQTGKAHKNIRCPLRKALTRAKNSLQGQKTSWDVQLRAPTVGGGNAVVRSRQQHPLYLPTPIVSK